MIVRPCLTTPCDTCAQWYRGYDPWVHVGIRLGTWTNYRWWKRKPKIGSAQAHGPDDNAAPCRSLGGARKGR